MRALFEVCFGHAMQDALWQWKYGANRGVATAVWHPDGQLTAHYGGMFRQVLDAGQPCRAIQIGDVMVRQQDLRNLVRKGPFFLAASHFLDRHIGFGKPAKYGFGFPNQRAMRIAERLGLYQATGHIKSVIWPVADGAALPWWIKLEPILRSQSHERDIARLWRAMARALPSAIVGVRDAARIQYRYLDHPEHPYRVWLLRHRLTRRPVGLIVLRDHPDRTDLLDLVADTRHWDWCALAARQLAARAQRPSVQAWVSASFTQHFQAPHDEYDLDVIIPCNTWSPGPDAQSQRNRWFLMGGDTDFL